MEELIHAINHALNMGRNRLEWYSITKDENHMRECKEWNEIANMYINKLISDQKVSNT